MIACHQELSRFCPYINAEDAMVSKCVMFENGLKQEVKFYKWGVLGHYSSDCKKGESCYKCGQKGHKSYECKREITCYNYCKAGHLSTKCTKPKKAAGKVFALNAEEVEQPDNLICGMCFINITPLIAIIDTGASILLSRAVVLSIWAWL